MQIHCLYDKLVNPKELKDHPLNTNEHSQDQIERLAKLMRYHGIRDPIKVSKQTGFITSGHGRKLAAIRAGIKEYPVVYQDYESLEVEESYVTADNAIAKWAFLNLEMVNERIPSFGPNFDIENFGIKDLTIDFSEKLEEPKKKKAKKLVECPNCGEII